MREYVTLECGTCKDRNYRTQKKIVAGAPRLELQKFCPKCRARTAHKERKK